MGLPLIMSCLMEIGQTERGAKTSLLSPIKHALPSLASHEFFHLPTNSQYKASARKSVLAHSVMDSKILYAVVLAAVAVSSFAGVAFAAEAPAPSPTSGAAAVSSSLVAAILCPAVALLLGNLRH